MKYCLMVIIVESLNPLYIITLNNSILHDTIYPLQSYKFNALEMLYIYIDKSLRVETTRINYLDFNGKINTFKEEV